MGVDGARTRTTAGMIRDRSLSAPSHMFRCSTVLAVCGEDYCVIAGDTRMSVGYSINSRTVPKLAQLCVCFSRDISLISRWLSFSRTSRCVIASSGMQADALALHKNLKARIVMYEHQTGKEMVRSEGVILCFLTEADLESLVFRVCFFGFVVI
jgi:20S proteasome alpha/beta subunit